MERESSFSCPVPIARYPHVLLAHGGGGLLMHQLIEKMFLPAFGNPRLDARHDGAVLEPGARRLAFTTDSYVVRPLFFPGGDIGALAINGTVNDLAMCGARARFLSAGFILEEGLPMETLWRVVQSMQRAAAEARVELVTGDTKVVDRGKGDGIFINTAGIGEVVVTDPIGPASVAAGDAVIVSGDIGRHGMAIVAVRENLAFESAIDSDCAPLVDPVMALVDAGIAVHCLRDLTRGGLASALVEIAETSRLSIAIDEACIPVRDDVRGACEILGFDPLYVANEGRFVAFVAPADAARTVDRLKSDLRCRDACVIGSVREQPAGVVAMKSRIGATRVIDMLGGEQLPRIC